MNIIIINKIYFIIVILIFDYKSKNQYIDYTVITL
jgi:hypothetical protein